MTPTAKPSSVTRFTSIQTRPGWKLQTGSNIGGTAPSKYSWTQGIEWNPIAALLSVTGIEGKYCDWLAGLVLPLPANNTGNVEMTMEFAVDADTLINAQAIEMDTKITDANKITYNGSLQFDFSQSATLMFVQVDKAGGGWENTGISLPKFAADQVHTVVVAYYFNSTAKVYSVVSISIDGELHAIPASLQNLPGSSVGWAPNEILPQLQQDVNTKGGSWQWLVYDQHYDVW